MATNTECNPASAPLLLMLPVIDLQPDTEQGRTRFDSGALEGLARSLRESGVLEPLLLRCMPNGMSELLSLHERCHGP